MSSLGEALTMARRAAGLTQEQLAEAVGITQAALSRYENDLREPSEDVLAPIARVLGVTPSLLRRAGRLRGAMAVDAHMRRRKTAKPTVWRQLEARLNMYRLHAHQLFDEITVRTEQSIPTFDPIDTASEDAARMVRMQWRVPVGPIGSLVRWVEAAGCLVIEEDFGTSRVDGLSQWIDGHALILVNANVPTDRKRLTVAHELGHLVLHARDISDDMEADANAFAAEFLMPAETIRPQLRNLALGKLQDLKREWVVSMQALIERAHGLGVLGSRERTALYKRLSQLGWRTAEPISDLPPEQPQLARSVGAALLERGLSGEDVAQLAGFAAPSDGNPFLPTVRHLRVI